MRRADERRLFGTKLVEGHELIELKKRTRLQQFERGRRARNESRKRGAKKKPFKRRRLGARMRQEEKDVGEKGGKIRGNERRAGARDSVRKSGKAYLR